METRICSACRQTKNLSDFYQRKNHRKGQYYERCKECAKDRGRNYYHANHEKQLKLANIRKDKYRTQRKKWLDVLKNRPCSDCGKSYPPWVMDFDHREKGQKISSVSWIAMRNTSNFKAIKTEILKCDLVCANCHRQRTHDRILQK